MEVFNIVADLSVCREDLEARVAMRALAGEDEYPVHMDQCEVVHEHRDLTRVHLVLICLGRPEGVRELRLNIVVPGDCGNYGIAVLDATWRAVAEVWGPKAFLDPALRLLGEPV